MTASSMKDLHLKLVDKRTFERNIRLGHLKEDDYQKFVGSTPDDSGNFDEMPFEDPEDLDDPVLPDVPEPSPDNPPE